MDIESRLLAIEQRNARVSIDKAWERSFTRRFSIALITYLCATVIFTYVIPNDEWYFASLVPVMGYLLSTLGLPQLRRLWEKNHG